MKRCDWSCNELDYLEKRSNQSTYITCPAQEIVCVSIVNQGPLVQHNFYTAKLVETFRIARWMVVPRASLRFVSEDLIQFPVTFLTILEYVSLVYDLTYQSF